VALALILNITWAADIKCDVTANGATAEQTCPSGELYCHTETDENGDKTYGCGLCPNGDGIGCEQCVGNDVTPCNRVGATVGPKCNVTIGDVGTTVNCASSITKCYSPSDIYYIDNTGTKFTEYGCGDCPESANADACVQCDGTTDTACNAGSDTPTTSPDGYCFEQNKRPIGSSLITQVAYTGRQDCINLCLSFDSCKSITITPAWWRYRECMIIGDPYKVYDSPNGWEYAPKSCFAPIVCEVTSIGGPVPKRCSPETLHCYSSTDLSGAKVWGCGLCANRPGSRDCQQCVGNDETPCNKEGVTGGVICDMTIGTIYGYHVTTPARCKQGVTSCYDAIVTDTPIYTEYGCGGCDGKPQCQQCRGDKETACNSETKCNPLNNDDYRQFSHGNVMMLNTLLLPLLLALWV